MPCPALLCPIIAHGAWLICNPCSWMLVKILATFILFMDFYPKHVAFYQVALAQHGWGPWLMCVYPYRVIIAAIDETGLCSWVYAVRHA
jgi:hypothetical protein